MEQAITESFKISTLAGLLVCAITILGGCIVFLYKQVDKKDKLNRSDTEVRIREIKEYNDKVVDDLKSDIKDLKAERKTDKGIIQEVINTNKQLSETNSKLHSKLVDVDGKLDTMGKKVDKIEFIVVNSTNTRQAK